MTLLLLLLTPCTMFSGGDHNLPALSASNPVQTAFPQTMMRLGVSDSPGFSFQPIAQIPSDMGQPNSDTSAGSR